jgi:hypothetical protein
VNFKCFTTKNVSFNGYMRRYINMIIYNGRAGHQRLTAVILATWEAEIGRIKV